MNPAGTKIHMLQDGTELGAAAAEDFCRRVMQAVSSGKRFACALSGGSTPRVLFEALAWGGIPSRLSATMWQSVHFFWGDERCVPPDHPDSNYRMAHELLLSKVCLPASNIHRIRGELGAIPAAEAYELELRRFFQLAQGERPAFDLIYLGLGEDGHIASLFPGSTALLESSRMVAAAPTEKPGIDRVTLTLPVINSAACVAFLVAGSGKALTLQRVLEKPGTGMRLPATLVKPIVGKVIWFVDQAAASLLSRGSDRDRGGSVLSGETTTQPGEQG